VTTKDEFDHRHSTDNWAIVTYDKTRWIPMPGAFEGTPWPGVAEWAFDEAGQAFLRGGRDLDKHVVKKEVRPFAEVLLTAYQTVVGKTAAHKYYLYCPDYRYTPVATYIGLWKCLGTRAEALNYYGLWGTTDNGVSDVRPWDFSTDSLGAGVKTTYVQQMDGAPMYWVNYAFRNEEYNTDVHMFMNTRDEQQFHQLQPELDAFIRGLRCSPDPRNHGRVIGPDQA
jgi:hypothetical protein